MCPFLPEFLVSKETVVLHRWERSKQKFGFIGGNSTFIKSLIKPNFYFFTTLRVTVILRILNFWSSQIIVEWIFYMPVILLSKPIFQILCLEGLSLISDLCRPWMCSLSQDLLLESCFIVSNTQIFFFFTKSVEKTTYSLCWKSIFVCCNKLLGTSLMV